MTVYILTMVDYDWSWICGAFATLEEAEAARLVKKPGFTSWGSVITECTLGEVKVTHDPDAEVS